MIDWKNKARELKYPPELVPKVHSFSILKQWLVCTVCFLKWNFGGKIYNQNFCIFHTNILSLAKHFDVNSGMYPHMFSSLFRCSSLLFSINTTFSSQASGKVVWSWCFCRVIIMQIFFLFVYNKEHKPLVWISLSEDLILVKKLIWKMLAIWRRLTDHEWPNW